MRSTALLLVLLAAPLAFAPTALAATPTCASITVAGLTPVGPYLVPVSGQSHLWRAWAETNFEDGLQQVACLDADGALVAPDTFVAYVGFEDGGQPVCVPRVGCVWI